MATQFRSAHVTAQEALAFHASGKPGKLEITPTKPLATQRDLSLAYSPGVAIPVLAIAENPVDAYAYTSKGNFVAVVSNGTAILGLGNLGALAAKPVMEGKAALFKRFADIDAIDLLVDTSDAEAFINSVRYLGPSFGGMNLEDIKSPDCFIIEERLKELLDIPVFHDDQHGTAIVVAAGVLNGLKVVEKAIGEVKLVCAGAGAAALACLNLLVKIGIKRENIFVCDIEGLVYEGRKKLMDPYKAPYAQKTKARTLADVIGGADIFLGLSAAGVLSGELVARMAERPLIFAMANPDPEITPEDVKAVRSRCGHGHGPLRLPEPDQQRSLLSLHLPRRARRPRDDDQRRDEDRRRRSDRRARARRGSRSGGGRLPWRAADVRARLHHPGALRSPPSAACLGGGRKSRDGFGRCPQSDRRIWKATSHA